MPEDVGTVAVAEAPVGTSSPSTGAEVSSPETGAEVEAPDTSNVSTEVPEVTEDQQPTETEHPPETEENLDEFRGSVTARLRELAKRSPELAKALTTDPKLRDTLAATFRREEGYREAFPTVGEAREMREMFPRGLEDAKALIGENEEVAEMDRQYYSGDPRQQSQFVRNLYQQDPKAFGSLAAEFPKLWAELDPKGYQRTFSKILGATFESQGLFTFAKQMLSAAQQSGDKALIGMAQELDGWIGRYDPNARTKPDPRDEEFNRRQAELDEREEKQRSANQEAFNKSFTAGETKFQVDEIGKLLNGKLPKGLPEAKRNRIVDTIRGQMVERLSASRPFMRALNAAIDSGDLNEAFKVSRSAWARLAPSVVRRVLGEETPLLVQHNKTAVDTKREAAKKIEAGSGAAPSGAGKPPQIDKAKLDGMSYVEKIKYLTGRK